MCGLAALFEPGRLFDRDLLSGIELDLFHRGPDSGGQLVEPGIALVFRRLAILDPTDAADQPMSDAKGDLSLVYNGEIYNYRQLRKELEASGARFRSDGDSEVILEAYRQWGVGFLERLEGMYAFVLVDRLSGKALAARDPFGIKPLYFHKEGSLVAFSSEMRPLLRLIEARPDLSAVADLLTFAWAPSPASNLQNIERVPGGTAITIEIATGHISRRRFFDILDTLNPASNLANISEVHDAVEASVADHLASDVGYTMQLSGGVDSSLVAAISALNAGQRVASYSVKLDDNRFDESSFRAPVVERYGLDHTEVEIDGEMYAESFEKAVRHMEGPVPHGGCVMLMMLCERSRERSKVVLTGEGADEMFGGYLRYSIWRKLAWQERLGKVLPSKLLPNRRPFIGMKQMSGRDAAVYGSVYIDFAVMQDTFPELIPKAGVREVASRRFSDFRSRLFAVDQTSYLESVLLRQDKMSMAASVEARVPFLHLPILKLVNSLAHDVRCPGSHTKPILKNLAERYLPQQVIYRKKVGLNLPYADWLSQERALGRYVELLAEPNSRLSNYAPRDKLKNIVEAFRKGERVGVPDLMRLVNVEVWLRSLRNPIARPG